MSLGDGLKGALGGVLGDVVGQAAQGAMPDLIKNILGTDGLKDILSKLEAGGLAEIVSSWLNSAIPSLPISPDQIKSALGDSQVEDMAKSFGLPLDQVLGGLSEHLPVVAADVLGGGDDSAA